MSKKINIENLKAFCIAALMKAGLTEEDSRLSAEVFVTTDSWGTFTHGTRQIRGLMKNVRNGRLNPTTQGKIVQEGPSWAIVDAQNGMPPAISVRSTQIAVSKAKETGIAYVGVKGSSHFGAAGYYANLIAENEMFGLSMCNVEPCMTIPGAKSRVLGTNPIAYATPTNTKRTIMLDIATSAVAATKIFAAKNEGKKIPETWLVDENGIPTTDPSIYPENGAQLPMAGHKGYGIAVLVEILTSVLTGSAMMSAIHSWVADDSEPPNQGHAFIAIDVCKIMDKKIYYERIQSMTTEIKEAKPAQNGNVFLPGEIEWNNRERALSEGIDFPEDVLISLRGLSKDSGIDPKQYNIDLSE